MTELTIGFSTCPNDTFIFDALVNQKIPTPGLKFKPFLADVEELNKLARSATLDITKLSYHACGLVRDRYRILDSGSALGYGNGPLLVSTHPTKLAELDHKTIAIPGRMTTANLLLAIARPSAINKKEYLFSDIEQAVLSRQADAGVLIHETRFTYAEKGLCLILDLGQFWENLCQKPIPLGGIVIRRDLPNDLQLQVQDAIRRSLEFAREHPESSLDYMMKYAQDMREDILRLHVKTFVNEFSLSLGITGREAVQELFRRGELAGILPVFGEDIFV